MNHRWKLRGVVVRDAAFRVPLRSSIPSASLFYISSVILAQRDRGRNPPLQLLPGCSPHGSPSPGPPNLHQLDLLSVPQTNNLVE